MSLLVTTLCAQTAIFNIPSADTLPRGSWGLEADFITKPVSYRDGGYQTYGYRVAYGATNHSELGANFYYTWDGDRSYAETQLSVKQKVYESERYGIAVSGGAVVAIPLRSDTDRTSVMVYAAAQKMVSAMNGATFTGGMYHVFRGSKDFGTRTGAMLAVVQPVHRRFDLVADWFSGHNKLGYATAGVNYNITKNQYLLTGYSFGNSGRGNNALVAYYGFTF